MTGRDIHRQYIYIFPFLFFLYVFTDSPLIPSYCSWPAQSYSPRSGMAARGSGWPWITGQGVVVRGVSVPCVNHNVSTGPPQKKRIFENINYTAKYGCQKKKNKKNTRFKGVWWSVEQLPASSRDRISRDHDSLVRLRLLMYVDKHRISKMMDYVIIPNRYPYGNPC